MKRESDYAEIYRIAVRGLLRASVNRFPSDFALHIVSSTCLELRMTTNAHSTTRQFILRAL